MKTRPFPMSWISLYLKTNHDRIRGFHDRRRAHRMAPGSIRSRVINVRITPKGKKYLKQFFTSYRNDGKVLLSDHENEDLKDPSVIGKDIQNGLSKIP
jgi:hypothetical protein